MSYLIYKAHPKQQQQLLCVCLSYWVTQRTVLSLSRHGHAHDGHGHERVYARLGHIKRAMQEPESPLLPSD